MDVDDEKILKNTRMIKIRRKWEWRRKKNGKDGKR
jgi:hypothetical protein